jgi:hypothetical protein
MRKMLTERERLARAVAGSLLLINNSDEFKMVRGWKLREFWKILDDWQLKTGKFRDRRLRRQIIQARLDPRFFH